MNVVIVTTIACDAEILRCSNSSCQVEVAVGPTTIGGLCRTCDDGSMMPDRNCGEVFSLRTGGLLIRCIAENKDGWRCEDRGRDFCPAHAHLAEPSRIDRIDRVARPTPQAVGDA